jgi:hypothetical protein
MMKTKIYFFFPLCIFLFSKNQSFAQNAYAKANDVMKVFSDKKIGNSLDSFRVNEDFWTDSLSKTNDDVLFVKNFVTFVEKPFDESLDFDKIDAKTLTTYAKKYNYFAIPISKKITDRDIRTTTVKNNPPRTERKMNPYMIEPPVSYSTGFGAPAIIDGVSRFLVKRTKEELEAAFFEKFKAEIEKDKVLQEMIPQTYLLLRYQDYAYIPSMGETWTSAITSDLNNIPYGLSDAIIKHRPEMLQKDEVLVFLTSMMAAKQLNDGAKPYEILYYIDKKLGKEEGKNISKFLHFSNVLSMNLLREDYKGLPSAWITKDEFLQLRTNGQKYFWAFIFAENRNFFKNLGWKSDVLEKNFRKLQTVEEFLEYSEQTGLAFTSSEYGGNNVKKTIKVTESMVGIISSVVKLDYLLNDKYNEYSSGLYVQKYLPIARTSISILKNSDEKNYGAAMLNTLRLMNELFSKEQKEDETVKKTIFYLNFLTDVISSRDAADVQQVIERYALPTQSYRLKRNALNSVHINAYPGVYFGTEILTQSKNNGLAGGISAPIGFSMDWGHLGKNQNQSVSAFFPVIDVGAAFSYRWGKDANDKGFPTDVNWSQIFSPGFYLYWGVPRSPLAIGGGFQWTPKLRKITTAGAENQENALRIGVNTTVDIPIFNLWKKK